MSLNEILALLERDLGTSLSLSKEGKCSFNFNDVIDINIENKPHNQYFYAQCELCAIQGKVDSIFYEILLESHLLGQGTNGCLLSISTDAKKIILFKNFIYDEYDYESFLTDLQILIKTSIVFQKKLLDIYTHEVTQKNTRIPLTSLKI